MLRRTRGDGDDAGRAAALRRPRARRGQPRGAARRPGRSSSPRPSSSCCATSCATPTGCCPRRRSSTTSGTTTSAASPAIVESYISYLRRKIDTVEPRADPHPARRRLRAAAAPGHPGRVTARVHHPGSVRQLRDRLTAVPLRVRLVAVVVLLLAAALAASGLIVNVLLRNYLLAADRRRAADLQQHRRGRTYDKDRGTRTSSPTSPSGSADSTAAARSRSDAATEPSSDPALPTLASGPASCATRRSSRSPPSTAPDRTGG